MHGNMHGRGGLLADENSGIGDFYFGKPDTIAVGLSFIKYELHNMNSSCFPRAKVLFYHIEYLDTCMEY